VTRQRGSDLRERLERAFRALLRKHERVIVIGTDSPLLYPRLLRLPLSELRVSNSVLGLCPDGGYYLIGQRGFKARKVYSTLFAGGLRSPSKTRCATF